MEIWKEIDGFPNYKINQFGIIKSKARTIKTGFGYRTVEEKEIKPVKDKGGYMFVYLYNDGKKQYFSLHRLVANVFIPNSNKLKEVNHKDEDKTNNAVDNLEWCDRNYNANYGTAIERARIKNLNNNGIKVCKYDMNMNLLGTYDSIAEAGRSINKKSTSIICAVCKGKKESAYGYRWKYAS